MLGLPRETEVNKQIYKKALFMLNSTLKPKERDTFNDTIQSIRVVNELSSHNIAVAEGKDIKSIFVIEVILKDYEPNVHSIELLFQMIRQNIILVLRYEDSERLAIKCQNLFFTEWSKSGYSLNMEGLTLDDIWANFVTQISGVKARDGESIQDAVTRTLREGEIRKQIQTLEALMRKTKTKTKQFDIHTKILALKEQLE